MMISGAKACTFSGVCLSRVKCTFSPEDWRRRNSFSHSGLSLPKRSTCILDEAVFVSSIRDFKYPSFRLMFWLSRKKPGVFFHKAVISFKPKSRFLCFMKKFISFLIKITSRFSSTVSRTLERLMLFRRFLVRNFPECLMYGVTCSLSEGSAASRHVVGKRGGFNVTYVITIILHKEINALVNHLWVHERTVAGKTDNCFCSCLFGRLVISIEHIILRTAKTADAASRGECCNRRVFLACRCRDNNFVQSARSLHP